MDGQSYFQLISPLIFMIFALGFYLIFRHSRDLVSARLFAISYSVGTIAFLIDFFRNLFPQVLNHTHSNFFYTLTAVIFSAALITHYKKPVPLKALAAMFFASVLISSWFTYFDDNIVWRSFGVNVAASLIFAIPLAVLWKMEKRQIDRIILILLAVLSLQFTLRIIAVLWYEGSTLTEENWAGSLSAITLQFTSSIAALLMAMALFVMFGMEIILSLRRTGETDLLTGLLNRRGIDARLPEFEKGLQSSGMSHAALIFDIDHFKAVNDTYGHDAGDEVLKAFAKTLTKLENGNTIAARLGGEEFALLIYNTNVEAARLAAEYASSIIRATTHQVMDGKTVTTSVGIALWHDGDNFSDVMRKADQTLYQAKSDGRDRVCVAEPSAPQKVNLDHTKLLNA